MVNGRIYCVVERNNMSEVGGMQFDLINDKHYLLLANGQELGLNSIGMHGPVATSDEALLLTIPRNVEPSAQSTLILIHGSFMIVAWIGLTSIGIIFARYFKKTWTNQKTCGKDTWFIWHTMSMILTVILTIAGYIIIFVEVGEWRTSVHSVTGTIVMAFVLLQPIGAILRPQPTAPNRPIFNYLHFCFGNITHLLAIITIFYAVPLMAAELPDWTTYVLVAFVAYYMLMHITFTVFTSKH